METILKAYYKNNAQKLHKMVDNILFKLKFDVDHEDFYSLANEIFVDVLRRYNKSKSKSFDGFLYSCLMNKFKTEMTRTNRVKRQADKNAISIETPISDSENSTVEDILADKNTVESEFFEENEEAFSGCMKEYLSKLSPLQQEVLRLISIGFTRSEIIRELHISEKEYDDCYNAIHSYRNISILM